MQLISKKIGEYGPRIYKWKERNSENFRQWTIHRTGDTTEFFSPTQYNFTCNRMGDSYTYFTIPNDCFNFIRMILYSRVKLREFKIFIFSKESSKCFWAENIESPVCSKCRNTFSDVLLFIILLDKEAYYHLQMMLILNKIISVVISDSHELLSSVTETS